jgi:virginiamycin B lyase
MLRTLRTVIASSAAGALLLTGLTLAPANAATGDITQFNLPSGSTPFGVVLGPDGNIWVPGGASNTINRVAPDGATTSFLLPTANSTPRFITVGSDGNLWFTMQTANMIGKITTSGAITTYNVPTANAEPFWIAPGPDGALWFTEFAGNKIGRITTAGAVTEYTIPTPNSAPYGITAGPDGSNMMVFTQSRGNNIATISMAGAIGEVPLPANSQPHGIDTIAGQVWFAQYGTNKIARLIGSTTVSEINLPAGSNPIDITSGPGPSLWVTLFSSGQLAVFTNTGGLQATYNFPSNATRPLGIVQGSDGNMWVAASGAGTVARVLTGQTPLNAEAPGVTPSSGINTGAALTASNGVWSYSPSTYTYQWQRCTTSDAGSCNNIPGATASTYTTVAADSGNFVRAGVAAGNTNGLSAMAYSALVQVGAAAPSPPPGPTPAPTPAGPEANIGNNESAALNLPAKSKRKKSKNYRVDFSSTNVAGTVTFTFTRKNRTRAVENVPVRNGIARTKWRVPPKWPTGRTRVTATFTPATGTPFTAASMVDTFRVPK